MAAQYLEDGDFFHSRPFAPGRQLQVKLYSGLNFTDNRLAMKVIAKD